MVLVGSIGIGTFLFIFLACVLIVILLVGHNSKIGQIIFWIGLVVFVILFVCLALSPTEDEPVETDIVDKWYILIIFSVLILIGFIVAIVAFLLVVLLYQDFAVSIPS